MKLSYNWLKELVPELAATPEVAAEKLTMHSFETNVIGNFTIDPTRAADTILDTEMTPNRAHDALSHIGVAREIAALYHLTTQEPTLPALPEPQHNIDGFTVEVADEADTPRYINILMRGAKAGISPLWLQARLLACGLRPINTIVDISNYVLLEYGQPNHAFDTAKLPGKKTSVRRAHAGETITLLDGKIVELPIDALVITSNDQPIALAGIMGGQGTQVGEDTTDLLLEIANFRPYVIQQTAAALALRTEASARFAKGLSPSLVAPGAARLVSLLQELTGASVAGVIDYYPAPVTAQAIPFSPDRVQKAVGTPMAPATAQQALERLRLTVDTTAKPWRVTPPLDRLDLVGEHDLVEEVIRLEGLEAIPATPLPAPTVYPSEPADPLWREIIRDVLVNRGFTETFNVSFEPAALASLMGNRDLHIETSNPLAPEQRYLRTSLLPGLVANFVANKDDFHKKFASQVKALFEIGHVFAPSEDPQARVAGIDEEEHLAGMLIGTKTDAARVVEAILIEVGLARTSDIVICETVLPAAVIGKMKYRLPVAAFELNLSALYARAPKPSFELRTLAELAGDRQEPAEIQYKEFSRYPSILRDISLLVEEAVTPDQAQEIIERVGGKLVVDSELFDEFQPSEASAKLGSPPQKGLAFHVEYQALDRTLSVAEIEPIHNRIIEALEAEINAQIR